MTQEEALKKVPQGANEVLFHKETPQETQEIATLEGMKDILENEPQEVADARVMSPVDNVEQKLSEFLTDVFRSTNRDLEFVESIKKEILIRLPTLNTAQIIGLLNTTNINLNDKISKALAPSFQLLTATKNFEIAEQTRMKNAPQQIEASAPVKDDNGSLLDGLSPEQTSQLLQGLNTVFNVTEKLSSEGVDK